MDSESVVVELFERFPKLWAAYEKQIGDAMGRPADPYFIFRSVLMPALQDGMNSGDLATILPICAFLEDVAESARNDRGLKKLLRVEVGEWLGGIENEAYLTPWLGTETKRICGYVPGLATQRRVLKAEQKEHTLKDRIFRWLRGLAGK
jgi:hypothetical protein